MAGRRAPRAQRLDEGHQSLAHRVLHGFVWQRCLPQGISHHLDIAIDPLWSGTPAAEYREIALRHGLRAAWSQPLLSKNQEVLGTFAFYYIEPRSPSNGDLQLIEGAGHIALIAIERERSQVALRTAYDEIKKSEQELRRIVDAIPNAINVMDPEGKVLHANQALLEYTGLSLQDAKTDDFRARIFHPEDFERINGERQRRSPEVSRSK